MTSNQPCLPSLFVPPTRQPDPAVTQERARQVGNREKVLAHLQAHGAVFNYELVQIGGIRAMGRVHELQRRFPITVEHVSKGVWRVTLLGAK